MDVVRVAAVGDLHCTEASRGALRALFAEISACADVVLLCGDLTHTGRLEEAQWLVAEIESALCVPGLAVLGNHDCESDEQEAIRSLLESAGVPVLDGESRELFGLGFAGVKGFGGGFGPLALDDFGEAELKDLVAATVREAEKLEAALASLTVEPRIALMHYAPTAATLVGEPLALYPFLGSSRLEAPLARHGVQTVFHGHAHFGAPEGWTPEGVRTLNVAMPVLERHDPLGRRFRVVEFRTQPPRRAAARSGRAARPADPEAEACYRQALGALREAKVDFLLAGSHAFEHHTGIRRHSKDLDVIVRPYDRYLALDALLDAGFEVELRYPHWLGRAQRGEVRIDVIYAFGNGLARVDDAWFEHAVDAEHFGAPVRVCPVEEMIWSKAFVMERDRFDGADVAHLLHAHAERLDWERLLARFGEHGPVLLAHLVLFAFIYPAERSRIPGSVYARLLERLEEEFSDRSGTGSLCRGGLFSATQYQVDFEQWSYADARLSPHGVLTASALTHVRRLRSGGC